MGIKTKEVLDLIGHRARECIHKLGILAFDLGFIEFLTFL